MRIKIQLFAKEVTKIGIKILGEYLLKVWLSKLNFLMVDRGFCKNMVVSQHTYKKNTRAILESYTYKTVLQQNGK